MIDSDTGRIYDTDSQKHIADGNDYSSKKEAYALIEKYMDRQGYFPSVFSK